MAKLGAPPTSALFSFFSAETGLLVASADQLFEVPDPGSASLQTAWKKIQNFPAGSFERLRLFEIPENQKAVLALKDSVLYQMNLMDRRWERIYTAAAGEKLFSFAVSAAKPRHWYLATSAGIKESLNAGKNWGPLLSFNKPADTIAVSENGILVSSGNVLFHSKDGSRFEKVLELKQSGEETVETESGGTEISDEESGGVTGHFYELLTGGEKNWAASSEGVFECTGSGRAWNPLPRSGFRSAVIRHLAYDSGSKRLVAAENTRVYEYSFKERRWKEILQGSHFSEIRELALDSKGNIFVLTPFDLLRYSLPDGVQISTLSPKDAGERLLLQKLIRLEPSAREIHRAVSRFANTSNWKLRRWHAESRLRALVPSVSFGKDFSKSRNIDIDRGGTSDKDVFIEGPNEFSKKWDVGVSWDLADFIFSTSQTSIDSREKLMVELRHDLTSEATRLYYERRRLQTEVVLEPSAVELEHFQKLIQIEELTALLDSMTNGFMSKRLEILYEHHPEFEKLWEFRPEAASANPPPAISRAVRKPR